MDTMMVLEGAQLARALAEAPPATESGAALRCRTALGRLGWTRAHHQAMGLVDADGRCRARADHYRLEGTLGGCRVRICGIGGIAGSERGVGGGGAELVEMLVAAATADGVDLAIVTGRAAGWLEPAGFRDLQVQDRSLHVAESRRGAPMVPVRSGERADVAHLAALPPAGASPDVFRLERSADLLDFTITRQRLLAGTAPAGARQLHFLVAEEGMRAVAWIAVSVSHDGWRLESCGDADPTGARVGALLQALLADAPAERRPLISAWLPPGWLPPQLATAAVSASATHVWMRPLGRCRAGVDLSEATAALWHGDPPWVA